MALLPDPGFFVPATQDIPNTFKIAQSENMTMGDSGVFFLETNSQAYIQEDLIGDNIRKILANTNLIIADK